MAIANAESAAGEMTAVHHPEFRILCRLSHLWPEAQNYGVMNEPQIHQLCAVVRETSLAAHRFLRHGHYEKIYENSLANRLRKLGLNVRPQHPVSVYDEDGALLGDFFADLLIEGELILELKAVRQLADEHLAQVLGYLRASRRTCDADQLRRAGHSVQETHIQRSLCFALNLRF